MTPKHPAKFSDVVLERINFLLEDHGWPHRILDPFAGTGRVHRLVDEVEEWFIPYVPEVVGIELEPEWAQMHPRTEVGNALDLRFPDGYFDGLVSSPTFGNRLADHHDAQDGSVRHSYTHDLGRKLHADNSGQLQWGDAYRDFHDRAWTECLRVLQPESLIIINISNHIRGGEEQRVTEWHLNWFLEHDCTVLDLDRVNTRRLRFGANRDARARYENIFTVRYQPSA